MTPPPFVARLEFEAFLRTRGSATSPTDNSFPVELRLVWHISITNPHKIYYFPYTFPFRTDFLLSAFTPKRGQQLLLDYSEEDPTENVFIEVIEHDTRTITWHHSQLRGLVRKGFEPHDTQSWELLPNPIYFRKLDNRLLPSKFANVVSQLVRAFPERIHGAYSIEMQKAISAFIGDEMPPPRPHI